MNTYKNTVCPLEKQANCLLAEMEMKWTGRCDVQESHFCQLETNCCNDDEKRHSDISQCQRVARKTRWQITLIAGEGRCCVGDARTIQVAQLRLASSH